MTNAICKEISMRHHELGSTVLNSVYLGGGTPSILTSAQLDQLFNTITKYFTLSPDAEITIEANPDDITAEKLNYFKESPINRFSLGVQSFFAEDLKWMNRAHDEGDAERAIRAIKQKGFELITIDLIYGTPTLSLDKWEQNLKKVLELELEHISAYCLTVEENTALAKFIDKGKATAPDDAHAAEQFSFLVKFMEQHGFEQYEISNFAKNQRYAKHNTAYWQNKPYLGIGPSAHSFNGTQRGWNIANNQQYMKAIESNELAYEFEVLTTENRINEYIMTGLRTQWGCDWSYIQQQFGDDLTTQLKQKITQKSAQIENTPQYFKLNKEARLYADGIAADLFF